MHSMNLKYSSDSDDDIPLISQKNGTPIEYLRMMKRKCSSDSDDDIPLISHKHDTPMENVQQLKVISYDSLRQPSLEVCELCDSVFTTRFASIKHSASHIKVPLVHRCDECLFHFSSFEELRTHITDTDHKTSQFFVQPSELDVRYEEILQSIVKKQVVVRCHDIFSGIIVDNIDSVKEKINNNIDTAVRRPSLDFGKEVKKNSPERELIPTFVISSDSDSDSIDMSPLELSILRLQQDNKKTIQENQETEQENQETEQDYPETDQDNAESDQSNPEWVQWNQERESRSEREQCTREEEYKENGLFNFSNLKDISRRNSSHLSNTDYESIKSRIMFEEEFEDDDLFETEENLPGKPYSENCLQSNSYIIGRHMPHETNLKKNSFILGSQIMKSVYRTTNGTVKGGLIVKESYAESIHYDQLIVPQLCDCRYCGRCFCNRLDLIKHEVVHMRLRRPRPAFCALCERYLAGNYRNLKKHLQLIHPKYEGRKLQIQKCKICFFNYHNYRRHVLYFHQLYECGICKRRYDKEEINTHDCTASDSTIDTLRDTHNYKVVKMCEICLSFNKNSIHTHYVVIGEHSELGAKQQCDRCHNKYFAVNLVKRKTVHRGGPDIYKKKAPMSNQQRLKKIQNRLKMVNKMNKC